METGGESTVVRYIIINVNGWGNNIPQAVITYTLFIIICPSKQPNQCQRSQESLSVL